ncbi:MAG TPA: alpha/beta fold hydrolase [Gemmataceae bacterium]|nr:alpha/beta fold hydrolase [Gemmataceae bacterium]
MLRPLALAGLLLAPTFARADEDLKVFVRGYFLGTLKIGAVELRLGFDFGRDADGAITATMDSLDQGVSDRKVAAITFEKDKSVLTLKMPDMKAEYVGTVLNDGDTIKGDFTQGGMKLPLELKRQPGRVTLNRPQTPKKPYPYESEDLTFPSRAKGVTLAASFTRPKGAGPFAAVALISGSGPQDRDESLMGHKPFHVLADHLTRAGVSVLRYDDRGIGKSTGDFLKATTRDFADDAAGAVAFLKARKDVGKVGLIGHSEGALIAPMVAAESTDVAFIVLLGGPGVTGEEILYAQGQAIVKAMGGSPVGLAVQKGVQQKLFALVKEGADETKIREAVQGLVPKGKEADGQLGMQLGMLTKPWFKFFLTHDPKTDLVKVKCPVLAITGEKDLQVPPAENLSAIESALKGAGNSDVTTKTMTGLNHLFQTCKTGLPAEYGKIEETFAPAALDEIAGWIKKRAK